MECLVFFLIVVVIGGALVLFLRQNSLEKNLRQEIARLDQQIIELRGASGTARDTAASAQEATDEASATAPPIAPQPVQAPPPSVATPEPLPAAPPSPKPLPLLRGISATTADAAPAPATPAASSPDPAETPVAAAPERQGMDLVAGLDKLAEQSPFIHWFLGSHIFVRVGIVILFIGIAFLLKYAADQGWLSIEARLIGAAVTGAILVGVGWRLRRTRRVYGLTLQGGGLGIIYLTVFVAYRFYELLPGTVAFPLLVLLGVTAGALAVLSNAKSLAVLAIAGAFAAPLLVDTGSDNAVAFFIYLTLVNAAILGIAWFKAWRELNLIGFAATVILGTLWGIDAFTPELIANVEPFIVLFFVFYLAIGLLFAMRQPPKLLGLVDGPLIVATPVVALLWQMVVMETVPYGLAISLAAVGVIYLALGARLTARPAAHYGLLRETYFIIGTVALTLAVPAAFDNRITVAIWAVAGAGIAALGLRQARGFHVGWGVAMQFYAGFIHLYGLTERWWMDTGDDLTPWLNAPFVGGLLLAGAGLATAYLFLRQARQAETTTESPAEHPTKTDSLDNIPAQSPSLWLPAHVIMTVWGLGWWYVAGLDEIGRLYDWGTLFDEAWIAQVALLFFVVSGFVADYADRHLGWPTLRLASLTVWLPTSLLLLIQFFHNTPLLSGLGWLAWPAALVLHFWTLRGQDENNWLRLYHPLGLWLVSAVGTAELIHRLVAWDPPGDAWRAAALVIVPAILILALALVGRRWAWPPARHERLYLTLGAGPLIVYFALWTLLANLLNNGDSRPLGFLPLLNPVEVTQVLLYAAGAFWYVRLRQLGSSLAQPLLAWVGAPLLLLFGINGLIARIAYHYYGVPYDLDNWLDASTLQTTYAIVWTILALACMLVAARQVRRPLWLVGAALLGVTVIKLLVLDMSGADTLARIISFIVVGLLMLLIGYIAPIPPLPPQTSSEQEVAPAAQVQGAGDDAT